MNLIEYYGLSPENIKKELAFVKALARLNSVELDVNQITRKKLHSRAHPLTFSPKVTAAFWLFLHGILAFYSSPPQKIFVMKILGESEVFVSIEINRNKNGTNKLFLKSLIINKPCS